MLKVGVNMYLPRIQGLIAKVKNGSVSLELVAALAAGGACAVHRGSKHDAIATITSRSLDTAMTGSAYKA